MKQSRDLMEAFAKWIGGTVLMENDQWENRLEIHSETSSRKYVVAQNKKTSGWGCSCPGWRTHRYCKHLDQLKAWEIEYRKTLSKTFYL